VPIDLDMSYWNPSGNQQVPAMGGFEALGPAIVLTPSSAMPTNVTCGLTFDASVVDKQNNKVCAAQGGGLGDCTPGDLSAFQFKMEALRVTLQGISDNDTGVARTDDIIASFNAPVAMASIANITMTQGGAAFNGFTATVMSPTTVRIHPTAAGGFAATT